MVGKDFIGEVGIFLNEVTYILDQVMDRIEENSKDGVMGRVGQRTVKPAIELGKFFRVSFGLVRFGEKAAQFFDVLSRSLPRCGLGDLHFENTANLVEVVQIDAARLVDKYAQRFCDLVAGNPFNNRSHTWAGFKQTFCDQHSNRFAQRRAAHPELLGQLSFRGKHHPGRERSFRDLPLDFFHHTIYQAIFHANITECGDHNLLEKKSLFQIGTISYLIHNTKEFVKCQYGKKYSLPERQSSLEATKNHNEGCEGKRAEQSR